MGKVEEEEEFCNAKRIIKYEISLKHDMLLKCVRRRRQASSGSGAVGEYKCKVCAKGGT